MNAAEVRRTTFTEAQNAFYKHCRIKNLRPRTITYYTEDLNYFHAKVPVKYVDEITQDAIGPYSQAMTVNGFVFTSGQIAIDPRSGQIEENGIEGQTRQAILNLASVLEAAGSGLEKAVKTTCFLQNMTDFAAFNEVYARFFPNKPARSCVEVAGLPKGALVEIEVIAELGK